MNPFLLVAAFVLAAFGAVCAIGSGIMWWSALRNNDSGGMANNTIYGALFCALFLALAGALFHAAKVWP